MNSQYDLNRIDDLALAFSRAHDAMSYFVSDLEAEIRKLKRQRRERFRRLMQDLQNTKSALTLGVEGTPELFERPKTVVLHGVKVGYRKGKGRLTWANDDQVIKKIREQYIDEAGVLISTVERPNKDALEKLSAADLKRLGILIEGAEDQVVVRSTATDLERMIDALLKDDTNEIEEIAA